MAKKETRQESPHPDPPRALRVTRRILSHNTLAYNTLSEFSARVARSSPRGDCSHKTFSVPDPLEFGLRQAELLSGPSREANYKSTREP